MGSKIIIALLVVQLLAIALLAEALIGISGDLKSIRAGVFAPQTEKRAADATATQVGGTAAENLTEAELRQIIADEIDAGLSGITGKVLPTSAEVSVGTAEQSDKTQRVAEAIDYHISVGSISTAEMDALQAKIAALDPVARKRMLNELVSAMNAGLIDGRL